MKKIVLSALVVFAFSFPSLAQNEEGASLKFMESMHDFGDIKQGDKVSYVFKFKNRGNAPLLISNIITTCGCTAPSYPQEPVMPGEIGEVTVAFDSKGKMGIQNKVITVISNGVEPQVRIKITANVLP